MLSAPKLRDDLAISRQETSAGTFFIIKDPSTGNFFRIREAEQFIAAQLDGTTVMDVVRQRTEQKFQAALSEESLNAFVKTLNNIGLLESKQTSAPGPERRASGTQRSLLYFRVSLFDPDRLFNILEPRLRWIFTSTFMLCSASTITLGLVSVVANWDQYLSDLGRLYNAAIVPIAILLSFLVVGLHEFAHGLTCKHFGGEVHEIGFLLFYFQPALYCNVSDAWLFQNRSSRLWVGFAGPYFELSVWAAAVMAWRVLDPETWLSTVALIIMTTSGIKTILNFNPFLKLDGYYLLSDYLEIPNLRRRSFRHVGNGFRRLIGLEPTLEKPASTRERRIYTVYGLVASAGSFMLLAYIVASAGGLLIEKGTPVLAVLSAVLIFVRLRHRFTRMFGRGSNSATSDEDGDVLSHSHAAPEPAARSDRRRRKGPSWRRWLRRGVLLALLGVLGCMAWFGHTDLRIAGPFTIAPKEPTDIRTAVEGVVESIDVGEGSSVQAGQIVMRLSDRELRSDLAKTEAEIRETAARIRLLETGPLSDEIDLARAAVTKAEGRVNYAETRQERAKVLFEERLRPRNEYDEARESVTLATNELAEAKGRLNVLLRGNRPEQIEAARAQMERLETEKRYIEQQLRLLTVVSPVSGIVATPARQLNEMRRTLVRKGDSLLKVYNPKLLTAQILISEREIEGVRVGQPVVLRTRAYPDREFRGKVTAIATTAQSSSGSSGSSAQASFIPSATTLSSGNKTILVITDFSNDQLQLKAEMTGHAKIYCGSRRVFDVVSRRIARTFKVEIWSWW